MKFFIENFRQDIFPSVLDEIVDGERDALDRVLQVRVGHSRVVDVNSRTRVGLLQHTELAHRPRLWQQHLAAFTN